MAKIVIAGDAVVVTSAIKYEDLLTVKKYRPDALILKGGEDGKEPIFGVNVTNGGVGEINQYGATFGMATRDDEKLATLTMLATGVAADIENFVADKIGGALINLNKLEATLPNVIAEINAEKKAVLEAITVAK